MIKDSRDEVIRSLIQGILFAGLVVLFSFGGLISSTVLTLVVVPVVYSILDDIVLKLRRKKAEN